MKVLVLGGCGFLGSNICKRLLNKGYEVLCVDNLSTGSKKNVWSFMYDPKFTFLIHDITESFPAARIDAIINCTWSPCSDLLHDYKSTTYGAFNCAGIAKRNNAKVINVINLNDKDRLNTLLGLSIFKEYKIRHNVLSYNFYYKNVIGESMHNDNLINYVLNCLKQNQTITMHAELNMLHISDFLDVVSCALDIKDRGTDIESDYNVTGILYSAKSFLEILFKKKNKIIGYDLDISDIEYDTTLTRKKFHWMPKINVLQEVPKIVTQIENGD